MGFFSVNNRAPGAGQVMSNWAGEINQKNKAESYKKAGSELMQLFDALEGEDRVNPKKVNQVVSSVWAKYPDLDQQDQRNIALMAKQAATEELKYKEYQQSQDDRARTQQDRITSKNDENAMATLLKNKYFPGSAGPKDDYDIDAPRGEGAAESDMVNNMSGKGIMSYIDEMNNAKTREQKDELFDLNKRKLQKDIDNPNIQIPNSYQEYMLAKKEGSFDGSFTDWKSIGKQTGSGDKKQFEKLKYIQNVVEASPGGDPDAIKAKAATEFDAYYEGWKIITNPKTGERGWLKSDGTAVDSFGTPIRQKQKEVGNTIPENNMGEPTPFKLKSTPERLKEREEQDKVKYGLRTDGTPKGRGYFGELKTPDGDISTEVSIGIDIDGKEVEIPILVPTLTYQEIKSVLDGGEIPQGIIQKAIEHAKKRISEGKNPFAESDDEITNIPILDKIKGSFSSDSSKRRQDRDKKTFLRKPPVLQR